MFRIQQLQRPNALLKVLELLDDLPGTIVLQLFPILESLYGSKSLSRPNWDNRVQIIIRDLLLGDRVTRGDILEQLYRVETVLNLLETGSTYFCTWTASLIRPFSSKLLRVAEICWIVAESLSSSRRVASCHPSCSACQRVIGGILNVAHR